MQQPFVAQRPALAPVSNWFGMLESAWTLFEQWQVVQGIKHVDLALVTARMPCNDTLLVQDLELERIGFDGQVAGCTCYRHRIAIGLEDDLAVGGQGGRDSDTAGKIVGWEFSE